MKRLLGCLLALLVISEVTFAADIELPAPQKSGGASLMEALAKRQSGRSYSDKELEPQILSNLLWAAWGINRADGKRTAPSARDMQETDLYVVMKSGAYRYDAQNHKLILVNAGDHRKSVGFQGFVETAPVSLVFAADMTKMRGPKESHAPLVAYDAGYISQNIYLYCASVGLSTVALESIRHEDLKSVLKLSDTQKTTLGHPIGYPKE